MLKKMYSVISDGIVYIDNNPMTMILEAKKEGIPYTQAAIAGAEAAFKAFYEYKENIALLRQYVGDGKIVYGGLPSSVNAMLNSVIQLHEADFTPMAAVAGTTADIAAEAMYQAGADYAMANNGGDIAWRVTPSQKDNIRVGIISDLSTGHITHSLKINSVNTIKGIATSGLGGRSLTRGIASAVTILAASASKADAAATSVANACYCEDTLIDQCPAEEIDSNTDIRGLLVTRFVGKLADETVRKALASGRSRAQKLVNEGMIQGGIIFIGKYFSIVNSLEYKEQFEVKQLD